VVKKKLGTETDPCVAGEEKRGGPGEKKRGKEPAFFVRKGGGFPRKKKKGRSPPQPIGKGGKRAYVKKKGGKNKTGS